MFRILQRSQITTQALNRIRSRSYSTFNSKAHTFNRILFVSAGVIPVAISYQLLKQGIENETKEETTVPQTQKVDVISEEPKAIEEVPETQQITEEQQTEAPTTEAAQEESATEENSHQGAAYNPETGEINWDCPCLGGMAHGPCGEEFKEAFACFVYSETEPKGIDCIKKFENMRSCFKQHPEHYKEELEGDDEPELTEVEPASVPTPIEDVVIEETEVVDSNGNALDVIEIDTIEESEKKDDN